MTQQRAAFSHPILFALFPIAHLYASNVVEFGLLDLARLSLIAAASAAVLTFLAARVYRSVERGALVVSLFVLLFLMFGAVYDAVPHVLALLGREQHLPYRYLFAGSAAALLAGALAVTRLPRTGLSLTRGAFVVSTFLVGVNVVWAAALLVRSAWSPVNPLMAETEHPVAPTTRDPKAPNIYMIVLDGYANNATLREDFAFDNSPFTDALAKRGFMVPTHSRSNYPATILSLASAMNMELVNYITSMRPPTSTDWQIANDLIKHGKVVDSLRARGYQYVLLGTTWGPTETDRRAAVNLRCESRSAFEQAVVATSMLVLPASYFNTYGRDKAQRTNCRFEALKAVPKVARKLGTPVIAFSHFIVPHPPYVFAADGKVLPAPTMGSAGLTREAERRLYLGQLEYVNRRVLDDVDSILEQEGPNVAIMIVSDHGSAFEGEWDMSRRFLRERLRNFEAFYLSGRTDVVPDTVTLVNTFRIVLNTYFQAGLPMQPDRSYFLPRSSNHLFDMRDVTDSVIDR